MGKRQQPERGGPCQVSAAPSRIPGRPPSIRRRRLHSLHAGRCPRQLHHYLGPAPLYQG